MTAIWTSSRPTRPASASFETLGACSAKRPASFQRRLALRSPLWPPTTTTTAGRISSSFAPEAIGSSGSRPTGGSKTSRQRRASRHTPYVAKSAAFVDVDHDGDLDLFIVGFAAARVRIRDRANQLLRNNGDGTFTDITAAAKVSGGAGRGIAVVPTDFDNRRDMDLCRGRSRRCADAVSERP